MYLKKKKIKEKNECHVIKIQLTTFYEYFTILNKII